MLRPSPTIAIKPSTITTNKILSLVLFGSLAFLGSSLTGSGLTSGAGAGVGSGSTGVGSGAGAGAIVFPLYPGECGFYSSESTGYHEQEHHGQSHDLEP